MTKNMLIPRLPCTSSWTRVWISSRIVRMHTAERSKTNSTILMRSGNEKKNIMYKLYTNKFLAVQNAQWNNTWCIYCLLFRLECLYQALQLYEILGKDLNAEASKCGNINIACITTISFFFWINSCFWLY